MKGEFIDVGGVRLYCHAAGTRGSGPAAVLVHGFPTSSRLWAGVLSRVAPGTRLLAVDLLGYGRSDPPGGHDLSIGAHTVRLEGLLTQLGVRDATVVGHDVGALVAWRLARQAPERVGRVLLLNPALRDTLRRATKLGPVAARAPGPLRRAALARALARGWQHDPPAGRRAEARAMLRGWSTATLEAHLRGLAASATDPLLDPGVLPPRPMAVAAGAHDPWGGASNARRLADGNSGVPCRILEEAGHFLPDDAPQAVADLVHAFPSP